MKFNLNKLVRENVRGLQPYSSARDEYMADGTAKIFMDANENPFENGLNRYPDPQQRKLKAVLADRKGLAADHILLGNGSDEILDLIFRAFCEPNRDNIISMPPTYGMYKVLAGINAIENRQVYLTNSFELDVEGILKEADENTKLIFMCSPNNPTANSFSAGNINYLLDNFNGILVLDEAYIDFSENKSWLSKLHAHENLIVTQTLSKAYGMAGIRLGICYASPNIIAILNKIKPPYNVNELTQQEALKRVKNKDLTQTEVSKILTERNKLMELLPDIDCIEKVFPSDANFILARVDDALMRYGQLLEQGVVVRNRSTQPLCENTLRFTVGTVEENTKLLDALKSL